LITEEVISWLKETPPVRINVTLYGASDATYERLCGNPHGFTQAVRGIRLLKNAGIVVKINCSITPYNVDDVDGIFAFAKQEGLLVQASSYMFPPLRRDKNMVGWNDRLSAEDAAYQSARIACLTNGEDYFLQQMKNRTPFSLPGESGEDCPELPTEGEGIRCRAGKCSFWITWDGRILPCGMFPGEAAENVFEAGFENAWARVREYAMAIRMSPKCSKCQVRDQCKACAAMALTETGRFDQVPEYRCQMAQTFDKASKLLEHQILVRRRR
jgi:radical SAM protein with 4Fe4S-binding SPASM domain